MGYKISYLWLYAINIVATIILLSGKFFDAIVPRLINWSETCVLCMGVWMLLSLWGKAFEADQEYEGKNVLNPLTTKFLTFSLVVIESMTVGCITFENYDFFIPCIASLGLWTIAFIYLILRPNKLITPMEKI